MFLLNESSTKLSTEQTQTNENKEKANKRRSKGVLDLEFFRFGVFFFFCCQRRERKNGVQSSSCCKLSNLGTAYSEEGSSWLFVLSHNSDPERTHHFFHQTIEIDTHCLYFLVILFFLKNSSSLFLFQNFVLGTRTLALQIPQKSAIRDEELFFIVKYALKSVSFLSPLRSPPPLELAHHFFFLFFLCSFLQQELRDAWTRAAAVLLEGEEPSIETKRELYAVLEDLSKRPALSMELYLRMKERNVLELVHWNTLLRTFRQHPEVFEQMEQEMQAMGVKPDYETFFTLLQNYAALKNLPGLIRVKYLIGRSSTKRFSELIEYLLSELIQMRNFIQAEELLKELSMARKVKKFSTFHLTVPRGREKIASKVEKAAKKWNIPIKIKWDEEAENKLEEKKGENEKDISRDFYRRIRKLGQEGKVEELENFINSTSGSNFRKKGFIRAVVGSYAAAGDVEGLQKFLSRYKVDLELPFWYQVIHGLMFVLVKKGKGEALDAMIQVLRFKRMNADNIVYSYLLQHHLSQKPFDMQKIAALFTLSWTSTEDYWLPERTWNLMGLNTFEEEAEEYAAILQKEDDVEDESLLPEDQEVIPTPATQ
jgi:hypothetical protein